MPYCTLDQLKDRFGERVLVDLTDRGDVALGTVDVPTVNRAIADTDAVIDGYLATRYALPLSVTLPLITDLALTITFYKLHVSTPDEKTKEDQKEALRQLQQIATGTIRLGADGIAPSDTGGTGVRTNDRERPFTEANMKGWI